MKHIHSILFFIKRIIKASLHHKSLKTMLLLCSTGIIITSFATTLIWCIAQGFSSITTQTLQKVYPDIIINAHPYAMHGEKCVKKILSFYPDAHCSLHNKHHILIANDQEQEPLVLQLRTMEKNKINNFTSQLPSCIIQPQKEAYPDIIQRSGIMIGKQLATHLNLKVGDLFSFSFSPDPQSESLKTKQAAVTGIFETGLYEYDRHIVLCNNEYAQTLFDLEGTHFIYVKLPPKYNKQKAITVLQQHLEPLQVYSWETLYPGLAASMQLEQYALGLILLLIFIMSIWNMIGLLFMIMQHKSQDIALMYAMGGSLQFIKTLFISFALFIATISCSIGLVLARCGAFLLAYIAIPLPENIYYTNHIPVVCHTSTFIMILTLVIALSFFASLLATNHIKRHTICSVLKNLQ